MRLYYVAFLFPVYKPGSRNAEFSRDASEGETVIAQGKTTGACADMTRYKEWATPS